MVRLSLQHLDNLDNYQYVAYVTEHIRKRYLKC